MEMRYQVTTMGFELQFIPDFLSDHTLLGQNEEGRIREHCQRWCELVARFWIKESVTYNLRYEYRAAAGEVKTLVFAGLREEGKGDAAESLRSKLLHSMRAFGFRPQTIQSTDILNYEMPQYPFCAEICQQERVFELEDELRDEKKEIKQIKSTRSRTRTVVLPWWGPGGTFLTPFQIGFANSSERDRESVLGEEDFAVNVLLRPTILASGERKKIRGLANEMLGQGSLGLIKDGLSGWIGAIALANLKRLDENPFLVCAHVFGNNRDIVENVAYSLQSAVTQNAPFETPFGESVEYQSKAQVEMIDDKSRSDRIRNSYSTLDFFDQEAPSPVNSEDARRLKYLVDARGASTVFRFPVSVRGGIPGMAVRQIPPDYHPGLKNNQESSIYLGTLHTGGEARVNMDDLTRHALVTGFTGSGKSTTVQNILCQLRIQGVKILVIESAKTEYRSLMKVSRGFEDIRIFTLGDETVSPFRLNPFEILPGVRVEAHISRLQTCFEAVLPPVGPLPGLMSIALEEEYAARGWSLLDQMPIGNESDGDYSIASINKLPFPTMSSFLARLERLVLDRYKGEVQDNVLGAIRNRLEPFTRGSRGYMLNESVDPNPGSAILLRELFEFDAVILELNSLNDTDKSLIMMFILTFLREYREQEFHRNQAMARKHFTGDGPDVEKDLMAKTKLVHVTVIEEAHNVFGRGGHSGSEENSAESTKRKAVETFCNQLAEMRSYGEGLVIVDQSPGKLAPDAMRNTNLKIAHQLQDTSDREAIASTMIMSNEQRDYLGKIETGHAAIFFSPMEKATFAKVTPSDLRLTRLAEDDNDGAKLPYVTRLPYTSNDEVRERTKHHVPEQLRNINTVYFKECFHCKSKDCEKYRNPTLRKLDSHDWKRYFEDAFYHEKTSEKQIDIAETQNKVFDVSHALSWCFGFEAELDGMWCIMTHFGRRFPMKMRRDGSLSVQEWPWREFRLALSEYVDKVRRGSTPK